jgi:hypothetical protein
MQKSLVTEDNREEQSAREKPSGSLRFSAALREQKTLRIKILAN